MSHLIWKQESRLGRVCLLKWSEVKLLSRVRLFSTPWSVAYQAPPSVGFSRQEYWSGVPFRPMENGPFCICWAFQKALPLGGSLCTSSVVSLNPIHFSSVLSQISLPSEVFSGLDVPQHPFMAGITEYWISLILIGILSCLMLCSHPEVTI